MTQVAQTGQRGGIVASAVVAAVVSGVVTISALAAAGQLAIPNLAPAGQGDAAGAPAVRLMAAERAWEAQRRVQSADALRYESYLERIGADWQLRYEQTTPSR